MHIKRIFRITILFLISIYLYAPLYGDNAEQVTEETNTLTDAINALCRKANAILSWDLEIRMSPDEDRHKYKDEYMVNVLGQKVPKATAVRSAGSLHKEESL